MKLIFGTGNQAKLNVMKIRLKPLGINLIGLEDLKKGRIHGSKRARNWKYATRKCETESNGVLSGI